MTGVVVVTHGELAREFVNVTAMIVGEQEQMTAVSLRPDEDVAAMKDRIGAAIKGVDGGGGDGVLVLTDMFGGTPSNLSLPFHVEGKVEVLMGVNLPMLLKVASTRSAPKPEGGPRTVSELASIISEYGKRNIQAATDILRPRK